jgi:hypothetical protein
METGKSVLRRDVVGDHHARRPDGVISEHLRVFQLDRGGEEAEVVAEVLDAMTPPAFPVTQLQLRAEPVQRVDGRRGDGRGPHPKEVPRDMGRRVGHDHRPGCYM